MAIEARRLNSEKTIILVRHAHRNKEEGADNGLSWKGKRQSIVLARLIADFSVPKLVSSPKRRCVETLRPLSKLLQTEVSVHSLLDEQGEHEDPDSFEKRVRRFLRDWKNSANPITVACSHGDWIPLAVEWLVSRRLDLKKGGFARIALVKEEPRLIEMVQDVFEPQGNQRVPSRKSK